MFIHSNVTRPKMQAFSNVENACFHAFSTWISRYWNGLSFYEISWNFMNFWIFPRVQCFWLSCSAWTDVLSKTVLLSWIWAQIHSIWSTFQWKVLTCSKIGVNLLNFEVNFIMLKMHGSCILIMKIPNIGMASLFSKFDENSSISENDRGLHVLNF